MVTDCLLREGWRVVHICIGWDGEWMTMVESVRGKENEQDEALSRKPRQRASQLGG